MSPQSRCMRSWLAASVSLGALLVACAAPGATPGDRPTIAACVAWFNEHEPAGEADVVDVIVAAQAANDWNGEVPVCWVTMFQPECTIRHAMGPDWSWGFDPLPPGDCNPMRISVDVQYRLAEGRLIAR